MGAVLIILSGVPGSGKSAIAHELGRRLPASVLPVDPIEAAIWRCGIPPSFETGVAAYEVAAVLAESQLRLGLAVVVDAVSSSEVAREGWRRAARGAGAPRSVLEVVCSDTDLHRARLAARVRDIDGFPEPTWDDVIARRDEWEPWKEDRLLLDSAEPLADNVGRALAYVQG
jgi:predicted kinase